VRSLCTHAVARLGGHRAIPLLIQALDDPGVTGPDPALSVKGGAQFWLRVLTGQTFTDTEEWQRWWKENAGDYTGGSAAESTSLIPAAHTPETTCP